MIAIDTNLLVFAHRADAPFHAAALALVKDVAEGSRAWAIPWPCLHEFLAKVTHPRVFRAPTEPELALRQIAEWLRSPSARTIGESEGYMETFASVLLESKVSGAKVHDARIAAICLTNGVDELLTADRDFSRFARLRTRNPLMG